MKYRLIEFGKSILILLLVLAVIVLMLLVVYQGHLSNVPAVSALTGFFGLDGAEPVYAAAETTTYEAARPDLVVLTSQEGHSTVSGSFDEIDAVFDVMGRFLSEALGAAQAPQQVSLEQWQQALSGPGVYFHYIGQIPLSALMDWLRTSPAGDDLLEIQAEKLLLSVTDDGSVALYYGADGQYWCCGTELDAASLAEQLESWSPDGSVFAFESSETAIARLDGDSVLNLTSAPVLQNAAAASPLESDSSFLNNTATILGFNPWGDAGYTAEDGSREFNDGECRLTVTADGQVQFTVQDEGIDRFTAASEEPAALIETARSLLSSLMSSAMGDAELYLTGFSTDGSDSTIEFTYFLDGRPVRLNTEEASAVVVFSGHVLISLTLYARTYTLLDSTTTLLPAATAAALAEEGSYLTVAYADTGSDRLTCGWTDGS